MPLMPYMSFQMQFIYLYKQHQYIYIYMYTYIEQYKIFIVINNKFPTLFNITSKDKILR